MSELVRLTCPECKRQYRVCPKKLRGKAKCVCGCRFPITEGLDTEPFPTSPQSCSRGGDQIEQACRAGDEQEGVSPACPASGVFEQVAPDPTATLLQLLRRHRLHVPDHEIERKLGQGGFGAVFLSRHKVTGDRVALKVMRVDGEVTPASIRRFEREIAILRQLHHPNIVPLLDAESGGDLFCYTMPFYLAGSAAERLRREGGRLSIGLAVSVIIDVLTALDYAHRVEINAPAHGNVPSRVNGIVHRDVKPQNILLDGDMISAKGILADFGLAKAFEAAGFTTVTGPSDKGGTWHFMPPEQALDFKHAKPVSDVWSAAASLYYLLTGTYPRDARADLSPYEIVVSCPAVPIRTRGLSISNRLANAIDQALSGRIEDRIPNAAEFRTELETAL